MVMAKMKNCLLFTLAAGWVLLGGLSVQGKTADSSAFKTVTLRIKKTDGQTEEKIQALEKTGPNVFRLKIPIKDIPRGIDTIDIVSDAATAKKGEAGYFVVSTGVMGTFREEAGRIEERKNPMPLFGMKNPRGAFVGIVKGLKYEFTTVVEVKDGVYEIFPRFLIKEMFFDPYEDLVVDFYALEGDDATYSGMARTYRQYQLDRGEVRPLKERVKGNPQLAYAADTLFIRVRHGAKANKTKIAYQTLTNEPPLAVNHTFDDFMRIMKELKALGIDKASLCSVGWKIRGHDGRDPQLFPVEPAFGGEAKLREAITLAHRLGYQIVCHVNNTDAYPIADRWDEREIAKQPDGKMRKSGVWAGGQAHFPCTQRVYDLWIDEDHKGISALGFKGLHHIDVISCITPPPCHDLRHPCNRQQTADYMNKIGEKAHGTFGGFSSEGPCDHVAKTLDYALYVTAYPSYLGRPNPLMDRLVPLWQIAYHGIILSNPYYSTIDYNYDYPRKSDKQPNTSLDRAARRLKVYEFGGRPTYYYNPYRDLMPIKEAYDEYQPVKYLQYEFMESHDEIAKDVFVTKYSDGSEIVSNYSDKDFAYRGKTVQLRDFRLIKPAFMTRVLRFVGI